MEGYGERSLLQRLIEQCGREAFWSHLTQRERLLLEKTWRINARPNQLPPPGDWLVWLLMAGRGFGKTRSGAEFIRAEVESGRSRRLHLVGRTPADVRDVMVQGESGLLAISRKDFAPLYEPSKRLLTWPNGAQGLIFSSKEPDQLRGPQCDLFWCDELRNFFYPTETWDNLMFGLRLGPHPRGVVTTTPAPITIIRELLKAPTTALTSGSTYDNRSNLPASFFQQIIHKYEGTKLGQQEIYARLLEEMPGAPWKRGWIKLSPQPPGEIARVVVGLDPAASHHTASSLTGIVVVALTTCLKLYVLADVSGRYTPDEWAHKALDAYHAYHADHIIGEVNNGGDMIQAVLETVDPFVPFKAVHATRGKAVRAEPISALYEQGRGYHKQPFVDLEDQMCTWTPEADYSPDHMDALVWAATELIGAGAPGEVEVTPRQLEGLQFGGLRRKEF